MLGSKYKTGFRAPNLQAVVSTTHTQLRRVLLAGADAA
jgi:hypothetical protein